MIGILLFLVGVSLVVLNIRAINKEKRTFSATLSNEEISIQDYEVEIGKLRKEFAETILELQKEIEELKIEKYSHDNGNYDRESVSDIPVEVLSKEKANEKNTVIKEDMNANSKKNDNIIYEKKQNVSDEDKVNSETYDRHGRKSNELKKNNFEQTRKNEDEPINNSSKKNENIKKSYNNVKVDEISKMLKEGIDIDEISERVHMGKGEVLLIKELYIK